MTLMIAVFWGNEFLAKRIAGVPYQKFKYILITLCFICFFKFYTSI